MRLVKTQTPATINQALCVHCGHPCTIAADMAGAASGLSSAASQPLGPPPPPAPLATAGSHGLSDGLPSPPKRALSRQLSSRESGGGGVAYVAPPPLTFHPFQKVRRLVAVFFFGCGFLIFLLLS